MFFEGFSQRHNTRKQNSDNLEHYKALGLDRDATNQEIKKAYRKLAMQHHPDRGGDVDIFKKITLAFETLYTEPEERKKGPQVVHTMYTTLEEMYNGTERELKINRKVIDQGKGITVCTNCGGKCVEVKVIQMGPICQQIRQPCSKCTGSGVDYSYMNSTEVLKVSVQRGSLHGTRQTFYSKGDEIHNGDAGDAVVVIHELKHKTFTRYNSNLSIKRSISLMEALCGFTIEIVKLDGCKLLVRAPPGFITTPQMCESRLSIVSHEHSWEEYPDTKSTQATIARGNTTHVPTLKKAVETGELKAQGVETLCFIVNDNGVEFKDGTQEECLSSIQDGAVGSTMYILSRSNSKANVVVGARGQGLPFLSDPSEFGDLFVELDIKFPDNLTDSQISGLREILNDDQSGSVSSSTCDGGGDVVYAELFNVEERISRGASDKGVDVEDGTQNQQTQCNSGVNQCAQQ